MSLHLFGQAQIGRLLKLFGDCIPKSTVCDVVDYVASISHGWIEVHMPCLIRVNTVIAIAIAFGLIR